MPGRQLTLWGGTLPSFGLLASTTQSGRSNMTPAGSMVRDPDVVVLFFFHVDCLIVPLVCK